MLNLGLIINQGNLGGRGGLWPWKSGQGEGSSGTGILGGRGGQKLLPSVGGGVDFFWNNPFKEGWVN